MLFDNQACHPTKSVFTTFQSGTRYIENEWPSGSSKDTGQSAKIFIQMFLAWVPLGSGKKSASATMFYMTFLNLTKKYNARIANIH